MGSTDQRIASLEILITEQEALLEQYSDLFRDQQKQIDQLKAQIELIELKLSRYESGGDVDSGNEVPPHY